MLLAQMEEIRAADLQLAAPVPSVQGGDLARMSLEAAETWFIQQALDRHRGKAFNQIGDMSVFENVELPLAYRDDISRRERRELVVAALEQVEMSHRQKHFPAQLPGGQQQRVAIARALVCQPRVLLADEPTGNLDSKNAQLVMDLLSSLHCLGSTIVMVTHDRRSAERAGRRIALFDGKIVDDRRISVVAAA